MKEVEDKYSTETSVCESSQDNIDVPGTAEAIDDASKRSDKGASMDDNDKSDLALALAPADAGTTTILDPTEPQQLVEKLGDGHDNQVSFAKSKTPGAVSVGGTASAAVETSASFNDRESDDVVETMTTMMMVEAIPVQEIIATEVVRVVDEEVPSNNTSSGTQRRYAAPRDNENQLQGLDLEHVDIDNFEDGTAQDSNSYSEKDKDDRHTPRRWAPAWQVVSLVTLIVLVFFGICFFIFFLFVPRMDEVVDEFDDDSFKSQCIQVQQETLFHLEQLAGKGWIEFTLASGVIGALIYQILDECQDSYCASRPNPQAMETGEHFFYNLIVAVLEVFWFFTCIVHLICIASEEMKYPNELIADACTPTRTAISQASVADFEEQEPNRDGAEFPNPFQRDENLPFNQIGDLRIYFIGILCRLPQLVFLLISRGRLLLNNRACQHIALGWRKFWFWLKVLMEIELFIWVLVGMMRCLLPVLDRVRALVDETSSV